MGNYCTRSEPDDAVTKPKFSIGKDYEELEGQFSGEGVKKTPAWKSTITRQQLEMKREEFWNTRSTGRRNVWMIIKNAIETDHETSALLLQMSGIVLKGDNVTLLEDTNGNLYEIPPFIVNDPVVFANEKKRMVPKVNIEQNVQIKVRIRKPGVADDVALEVNNMLTAMELKQMYAEKEGIKNESLRLFFAGRELKYENTLVAHCIQNDMVLHAFIKTLEPE